MLPPAATSHIADVAVDVSERRQWSTKRLTTRAIDGGLGISYQSFEPDDFSQWLSLLMAQTV
jgi:hypothetical protein